MGITNGWDIFTDFVSQNLTDKVLDLLKKFAGSDLFIVCGDGGVGKSSFIKSITGEDVDVGSTLESGTKVTALVPAVIHGKRCLFLDMPGFNTVDFDNWDVFYRLMTAISVVQPYVEFRGVLFVDSFHGQRFTPSAEILLTWLSLFCGSEYMPNVTIVTTRWDGLDEDGIAEKILNIKKWEDTPLKEMTGKGATIYHHGLTQNNGNYKTLHIDRAANERQSRARDFIGTHYRGSTELQLQIYVEIENGAILETTRAGRWLKYGDTSSRESEREESASSNGNGTGQGSFWDSLKWEDMEHWAKLLYKAGKFFMDVQSTQPSPVFGQNFSYEPFEGAEIFPDDPFSHFPDPDPTEDSGICLML